MNKMFQDIFDEIITYMPERWLKIVFYAAYFEDSYAMKYFVKIQDRYYDCYEIQNVSMMELTKLFISLDKTISSHRGKLNEDMVWNMLTMSVSSDGDMKSEFVYDDLGQNFIEYEEEWKKKMLN